MKISFLGHASIFVETKNHKILMDPLLWDKNFKGLFSIFPKRKLKVSQLPKFDTLIISHQHLDHFDIRSLMSLSKDVTVLIPEDNMIEYFLIKMGYKKIIKLKEMSLLKLNDLEIFTTRSENRVPEFGVVFSDSSGVFWNQVDSQCSPKTIAKVKRSFGNIDLLLAPWQPLLENAFQNNMSIAFPFEAYANMIESVKLCKPTALIPGANGLICINEQKWFNQILYPISRERFCQDVVSVCAWLKNCVMTADPGDVVVLNKKVSHFYNQSSSFVRSDKFSDRRVLDFSPVNFDSKQRDFNAAGISEKWMQTEIKKLFERQLARFVKKHLNTIFKLHHKWNAIYQFSIIFPHNTMEWVVNFSLSRPSVTFGHRSDSNINIVLSASSLCSIMGKTDNWVNIKLMGHYRTFSRLYSVGKNGRLKELEHSRLVDPLRAMLPDVDVRVESLMFELKNVIESTK